MKCRVLETIVCPSCKSSLRMRSFLELKDPHGQTDLNRGVDGGRPLCVDGCNVGSKDKCVEHEIIEGCLECACGGWYPIINGVPRLLPEELRHNFLEYYPNFFEKYGQKLPPLTESEASRLSKALEVKGKEDTIYRFSYEWNTYKDYEDNNFEKGLGYIDGNFLAGKMVLDAGCGAGRHAKEAVKRGAKEVFALDISNSVDAAFENTVAEPSIHVIQGDIFNLPFKDGTLDLIYSLWALPHTHNPPEGFRVMSRHLREGGTIIVYLYSDRRKIAHRTLAAMRKVTLKMPNLAVNVIAFTLGTIDFSLCIQPYRILNRVKPLKRLLDRVTPTHIKLYAPRTFKTCRTDWLDRLFYPYVHYYSEKEVLDDWFKNTDLSETAVLSAGDYGMVVRGAVEKT